MVEMRLKVGTRRYPVKSSCLAMSLSTIKELEYNGETSDMVCFCPLK